MVITATAHMYTSVTQPASLDSKAHDLSPVNSLNYSNMHYAQQQALQAHTGQSSLTLLAEAILPTPLQTCLLDMYVTHATTQERWAKPTCTLSGDIKLSRICWDDTAQYTGLQ